MRSLVCGLAFFLLSLIICGSGQRAVTLWNSIPRLDTNGNILEVGDGSIAMFPSAFGTNVYYLYGAHYQPCPVSQQPGCYMPCGWYNTTFAVYTSEDLVTWQPGSFNILPEMTDPNSPYNSSNINSYFEPAVLFNAATQKYVLWYQLALNALNFSPHLTLPRGVATSDSPLGPFKIVDFAVPGFNNGSSIYFWVQNTTGKAYMVFNDFSVSNTNLAVAELTDDYLGVAAISPYFGSPTVGLEGGGIFERNGIWYVMSGTGCCFCSAGGSVLIWTSPNPLGPYTYQGSVNAWNNATSSYVVPAQQFGVFGIATQQGSEYLWVGIRYGSAPDGLKNHDYQYWWPLQFDSNGVVQNMTWQDNFQLVMP